MSSSEFIASSGSDLAKKNVKVQFSFELPDEEEDEKKASVYICTDSPPTMMYFDEDPNKKPISFGTTQDRGLFPNICAPDRLGNELYPLRGAPNRGPGCYENAEMTSFVHGMDTWICSNRGYTYGSRTAPRFRKEFKTITPSPTAYQASWIKSKKLKEAYEPFETAAERFHQITIDPMITPGPGVYEHEVTRNRHVSWPQQFGSPIHPIQPSLEKKTIKTELLNDKEFRKFRNRVAYFRLYY